MTELGPLKFGLNLKQSPKGAAAPVSNTFSLQVGVTGGRFDVIYLSGPPGATASIDWGTSPITSNVFTFTSNSSTQSVRDKNCGSIVTISGSNSLTSIIMRQTSPHQSITGITGTYPTSLAEVHIAFNNTNPTWTIPNIPKLTIAATGPSSLTFGSKLTTLGGVPSNLTSLDVSACPLLTSLDVPGSTGLSSLMLSPKLVSLDVSGCSALTGFVFLPPTLAKLKIEGSGLTRLDLTGTSITTLNIPPSMYPQLQTLKITGGKMNLTGLLDLQIPTGANWTLY